MFNHFIDYFKDKALKQSLFLSFGVCIFLFMFWYVNKYIVNFRAAYPIANVLITPATVTVNMSQDSNFTVTFNINGQKVTAVELYLDYDPAYVEYFKEYSTGTGFSEIKDPGKENYFDVPLIEEVTSPSATSKRLRVVLVSKFNDTANPAWLTNVTGTLKFRAKLAGTTNILVNKTVTQLAGVTGTGEATYFDLPVTDIKAAITIIGTGSVTPTGLPTGTITPTGSSTITPTSFLTPTTQVTPTRVATPVLTSTPAATPITSPTPTRVSTPTVTLTPSGGYQDVTLNFKIRFQGMPDKQPGDPAVRKLPVYVALLGDNRSAQNNIGTGTIEFTSQSNGIWTTSVPLRIDTSRKWNLFVKGPKHIRKRICSNIPQESVPGGYQCPTEISVGPSMYQMTFKAGANEVDLSNILLLAGDLPLQNGVIDAVDIAYIRANLGSQDQTVKARADLNYDGIVDAQDYSLILASLAFKYDEP